MTNIFRWEIILDRVVWTRYALAERKDAIDAIEKPEEMHHLLVPVAGVPTKGRFEYIH
jgi:hypothetical protein